MITYKLSKREKALLVVLAVVLVAIVWFIFVYQGTTDQITRIESDISTTETSVDIDTARISRMQEMQAVIAERKAEGARAVEVPAYDNMQPLMAELNGVMGATETYTLTFDQLDRETSTEYVYRGARIDFGCDSYATAERIVNALADGTYPCVIDSVAITDNGARNRTASRTTSSTSGSAVSAYVHVTFFEKVES